jgi:hypothetical protein
MPILKYHQNSLELTGSQPEFSGENFPNLPASVSEWFSLSNGIKLLEEYSNQDVPIHPSRFQACKFEDKNLLVFMYENQRVVCWAFENSINEDPPVYIIYDPSDDNFPVEFISEHCFLIEETFSEFIYKWLFDFSHWYDEGLFLIENSKEPLKIETLELLNKEFKKEPSTIGQFGEVFAYRFSKNDQKILIVIKKDKTQWRFSADTIESFEKLYGEFQHLFK